MGFPFAKSDSPWLGRELLTKLTAKPQSGCANTDLLSLLRANYSFFQRFWVASWRNFGFCRNGKYYEKNRFRSCCPRDGFHVRFRRRSGGAALYQGATPGRVHL